jgi:hypothetical protein
MLLLECPASSPGRRSSVRMTLGRAAPRRNVAVVRVVLVVAVDSVVLVTAAAATGDGGCVTLDW